MFRALVLNKDADGHAKATIQQVDNHALPQGDVTVAVAYSTLNYKDGLCLSPTGGGLVRSYPHVAGIDLAGTVESSLDRRYAAGAWARCTGAAMPRRRWSRRIGWCRCRRA